MFALDNYIKYYSIDDVIRRLYQRGHQIVVVIGQDKESIVSDDALQKARMELPEVKFEPLIKRKILRKSVKGLRELINFAHILNNEENRQWDVQKWGRFFHPLTWKFISSVSGKKILKTPFVQRIMRFLETKIPVALEVKQHVRQHNPDILIAMPLISGDSHEGEYVRAAISLGIPTVFSMFSWDNISTKGTFHSRPDYYFVWNQPLAEELMQLHNIPQMCVHVTGAPRFDRLIDNVSSYILSRSEFCRMIGVDENKKFILYVGSTFLLDANLKKSLAEEALVIQSANALQNYPETADIQIVVRPHPQNVNIVSGLSAENRKNIFVYPSRGEFPDTELKRQMFYNSIYHSIAVVGVNTTAFLEASALDRPCITIIDDVSRETQQLPHFHHLADAGFLEMASSSDELIEIIRRITRGIDIRVTERQKFVKDFLRPTGHPSVDLYIGLVEAFGRK